MDKETQTSFIPKKSLAEERTPVHKPVSLFVFVATIIFFASLAAAVGSFFYRAVLTKRVADMTNQLELAKARFEPSIIADLQTLDRRINSAGIVLADHIVVSPIFDALQALTLKTIRYTKFEYDTSATNANEITVHLNGQSAGGYTPIALQADVFSQNKYIKDPVFSSLVIDPTGKVNFDLVFTVDKSFVSYEEMIAKQAVTQPPADTTIPDTSASVPPVTNTNTNQ